MAGELRITGGSLVRRRIAIPPAADKGLLRPTSDKVRAAIFNSLADAVVDAVVLDLFAGSGALGIEALSRGAKSAVLIDKDRKSAHVIEENLAALGVDDRADVVAGDAEKTLADFADASVDLVLMDPPYALAVDEVLLEVARVLRPGGVVILERGRRSAEPQMPTGLDVVRDRVYGDTRVLTLERRAPEEKVTMTSAAIYPGSFDPLTNGHKDIITRGIASFDRIIVAVANNPQKSPLFSVPERIALVKECLGGIQGVEVDTFDGLIVEYAQKKGVHVLLRGLRAVSDFEYEFQLASMNRKLAKDVETVFMMTSEASFYLSSRLVREVASFGGDVSEMVPGPVYAALKKKFAKGRK